MDVLEEGLEDQFQKPCQVEEFGIRKEEFGLGRKQGIEYSPEATGHWNNMVNMSWNFERDWSPQKAIVLGYEFETPKYSRDIRSKAPHKTVKTEYVINTLVSLIGTVGGTMGMFVGFSIIGMFESLMAHLDMFWKWLIIRNQNSKQYQAQASTASSQH